MPSDLDEQPGTLTSKGLMARTVPWWVVLALGAACVVLGVWLLAEPFRSLSVLRWLVVAGLIVSGIAEVASADATPRPWLSRLIGGGWIVIGVVAAVWPGITILALAIAVGIALVAGGAVKIFTALFGEGDERFILGVSGLTNVVVGVLALSWPAVTVLVLAVIFGLRTVVFGLGQIVLAVKLRLSPAGSRQAVDGSERASRWPGWLRLTGGIVVLGLALGGLAISVAIHRASPGEPGEFYSAPSPLPDGPPGTIIRSETIDDFIDGATTYRVLYTSTGFDGAPTAVSGILVVPDGDAPSEGRNVIAFTHGTVGVASSCSPSLQGRTALPVYEGLEEFVAAGYVVAATDYRGLGTPGPHAYLVGNPEGMNALDSVRAARNLDDADAGADFAVWGHSQGGQASLFTGQLAETYAPELSLVGVAAGAPAANLVELFKVNIETTVGKILISMALQSWTQVYEDAELDQIVTPTARPIVENIAENCLYNQAQILSSVPGSLALNLSFLSTPPWDVEPWKTILADNTPGSTPTGVPMLITQGDADPIVAPETTAQLVDRLCVNGETVDYQVLPGVAHLEAGHEAVPDVAAWIADRFAGESAPTTCETS